MFLVVNQLERLLDVDVIAQQRHFLRKFDGLKGKQRICSNIFLLFKSYHLNHLLNKYRLTFTLLTF